MGAVAEGEGALDCVLEFEGEGSGVAVAALAAAVGTAGLELEAAEGFVRADLDACFVLTHANAWRAGGRGVLFELLPEAGGGGALLPAVGVELGAAVAVGFEVLGADEGRQGAPFG